MQIQISGGINNSSLQIGDDIYFVSSGSLANAHNLNASSDDPVLVGKVSNITSGGYIEIDNPLNSPASGDFIMFSKNKAVNNTSLIGYFAEVKLRNNSKEKAELFALSSETAESSK